MTKYYQFYRHVYVNGSKLLKKIKMEDPFSTSNRLLS